MKFIYQLNSHKYKNDLALYLHLSFKLNELNEFEV